MKDILFPHQNVKDRQYYFEKYTYIIVNRIKKLKLEKTAIMPL